jgi:hypothetical protein
MNYYFQLNLSTHFMILWSMGRIFCPIDNKDSVANTLHCVLAFNSYHPLKECECLCIKFKVCYNSK